MTTPSKNDAISAERTEARARIAAGHTQLAAWFQATLRRAAETLSEWRTKGEMYRQLGRLTDRDLEDIGVDRADLPNPVRIGGWPWR